MTPPAFETARLFATQGDRERRGTYAGIGMLVGFTAGVAYGHAHTSPPPDLLTVGAGKCKRSAWARRRHLRRRGPSPLPEAHVSTADASKSPMAVQPIGVVRIIVIAGKSWTVSEVVDQTTFAPGLIFTGQGVARRVRDFPADWRTLPDEKLYALSWSR